MADTDRMRCPVHEEFKQRLDDRWDTHVDNQTKINDKLSERLEDISSQVSKLNNKVSWFIGALFVSIPVIQLILTHYMSNPHK